MFRAGLIAESASASAISTGCTASSSTEITGSRASVGGGNPSAESANIRDISAAEEEAIANAAAEAEESAGVTTAATVPSASTGSSAGALAQLAGN